MSATAMHETTSENSRLTAAIKSAVQHLEHGRPSHALRDLTDALEYDGRCSYCGADASEAKPYIIIGRSCVQCGAWSREN